MLLQVFRRLQIERWIFADSGMRAGAGFHRHDSIGGDQAAALDALGIFFGDQIIGNDGDLGPASDETRNQLLKQRGFS